MGVEWSNFSRPLRHILHERNAELGQGAEGRYRQRPCGEGEWEWTELKQRCEQYIIRTLTIRFVTQSLTTLTH